MEFLAQKSAVAAGQKADIGQQSSPILAAASDNISPLSFSLWWVGEGRGGSEGWAAGGSGGEMGVMGCGWWEGVKLLVHLAHYACT